MEPRAQENSATNSRTSTPREDRNVWVLTAYGISGLAVFIVLAYYLSAYLTH
jgi:hypothetical protein